MKIAVALGLLGISLGYLIGVNREKGDDKNEVTMATGKSSRRLLGAGERRAGGSSDRKDWDPNFERISELARVGGTVSGIEEARMNHWILELEAGDFPEVLEMLARIRSYSYADPFGNASDDILSLGLVRWYELEGDRVAGWVAGNEKLAEDSNVGGLLRKMIEDRFARDPGGALAEVERYAAMLKADGDWSMTSWAKLVGRHSSDVAKDFETMRGLAEEIGIGYQDHDPFSDPDPFASSEEEVSSAERELRVSAAFCEGLIASGKIEEAMNFTSGLDPRFGPWMEDLIRDRELESLHLANWRELKEAVDHGALQDHSKAERRVLEEWAREDPEEAMDWFISQGEDAQNRGSRIAQVVGNWAQFTNSTGSLSEDETYHQTVEFLEQRSLEGDQVTQGWDVLMRLSRRSDDWDRVLELQDKVSQEAWEKTLEQLEGSGHESWMYFWGERFSFRTLDEGDLKTLEKFGLREKVQAEVDLQNWEAFGKLGEKFGEE